MTPHAAIGAGLAAHGQDPSSLPPLTPQVLLTGWTFEPVPAIGIAVVAVLYLVAVRRLRARGDSWSRWRTLLFVGGGLGVMVIATQSALAVYDLTLLSVHMTQHMLLNMVAPILLALGAPILLALRTLPGPPRAALLSVLHSRWAKVVAFPVVAGILFVGNPFVLYFTPLYEATLRNGWLHELNHLHFVALGCLWFFVIIGLDPMPNRIKYPMRMLAVFVTMPFHAFLGVTIMSASTLIAEDWYLAIDRDWGPSPLADQRLAGGIIWASGELVAVMVVLALFVQWVRQSDREARREDRRLDRQAAADAVAGVADNGLWWETGRR